MRGIFFILKIAEKNVRNTEETVREFVAYIKYLLQS